MQTPSADTKKMGLNQFDVLFPSLQEAQVQPPPAAPAIAELLAILLPLQMGIQTPRRIDGELKQANETLAVSDCLGISTPELKAILKMCGKSDGGTFDSLSTWF